MEKLIVNNNCIGCGACQAIDPEHFEVDGVSNVISEENLDSAALLNAIESCPVLAIEKKED
jgi:ferredoxin